MSEIKLEGKLEQIPSTEQTVIKVDNTIPDQLKNVSKQDNKDFEIFKTMYKDVIDMKFYQDYGDIEDKDLWEDCATELFLKSRNYILLGDEYKAEPIEKKIENKLLKTEQNKIEPGQEYINDFGAKITIIEPTKNGEYQFKITNTKTNKQSDQVFIARDIAKVLSDNGYKKVESKVKDRYTHWLDLVNMLSNDDLDEYMDTHDITTNMIDGKEKPDADYLDELITDAEQYLFEDKDIINNMSNASKLLAHISNGIIKTIQDKFKVTATAEIDLKDNSKINIFLKGNTLDLIDATSYLSKAIRNDDVDFIFDDSIKDNTVKCVIKSKKEVKTEDYNSIEDIENRIKEINKELAYIRRRDKVTLSFGSDREQYNLINERDVLRNKLKSLKSKKSESINISDLQIRKYPNEEDFKGTWGLYDIKQNKFLQKGPKYLMKAALNDFNKKSNKVESISGDYKPGDVVDILDSYGKWLNSSDRIKYVIDRPATKDEIKGIWDIDTPCYIVKTIGMTDDTKFLNGTSKEPITRLRLSTKKLKESSDIIDEYKEVSKLPDMYEYNLNQILEEYFTGLNTDITKYKYDNDYIAVIKTDDDIVYLNYRDNKVYANKFPGFKNFDKNSVELTDIESLCNQIFNIKPIKTESKDTEYSYMLLDRLKTDCEYFLHNGNGNEKHLWANNVKDQINKMKEIYNSLDEKPDWITLNDIDKYEKDMLKLLHDKKLNEAFDLDLIEKNIKGKKLSDAAKYLGALVNGDRNSFEVQGSELVSKLNNKDKVVCVVEDNDIIKSIVKNSTYLIDKTESKIIEKKLNESDKKDLSKDLYQNEANQRIYARLRHLDIYLEALQDAINNNMDTVSEYKSKIKSIVEYLIPALNIKGGVKGLITYLQNTHFDFINDFKQNADLILDNEIFKTNILENIEDNTFILDNLVTFLNDNNITIYNIDKNDAIIEKYLAKNKIGMQSYVPSVYKIFKDDYGTIGRINFNKVINKWEFYTSHITTENNKIIESEDNESDLLSKYSNFKPSKRDLEKMKYYYSKNSNPNQVASSIKNLDKCLSRYFIAEVLNWKRCSEALYEHALSLALHEGGFNYEDEVREVLGNLKIQAKSYILDDEYKTDTLSDNKAISRMIDHFSKTLNVLTKYKIPFQLEERDSTSSELYKDMRNGRCWTIAFDLIMKMPNGKEITAKIANHTNEGGGSYGVSYFGQDYTQTQLASIIENLIKENSNSEKVEEDKDDNIKPNVKGRTKWKTYVKQMAKLDCEYGHPMDSDDFESFYKILKDDNFVISEEEAHKAFDYYFECFDYYLERLNESRNLNSESKLNDIKIGDRFKGRIDGTVFEVVDINQDKDKITYTVNGRKFTTGLNHFKHTLLDKIEENNNLTESKITNYTLSQIRKILDSNGDNITLKISNRDANIETKFLDIDKNDVETIYKALAGNNNDLIKLPSEENSDETRDFIQSQLDKTYDKKYESRPDKDAARSRMFSNSRKKLNMPDNFSNLDEIVSYLEKCEDQIDVMNVNTHVGSFNRQLHNDMLKFADKFIKENGYLDSYHDKDGNEHEGSFKKFKQEMINFVKNYNLKTESVKRLNEAIEDGNSYFKLKLDTANIAEEGDPNYINKVKELLQQIISNLQYTQDVVIKDIGIYGFGFEGVIDAFSEQLADKYVLDSDSYFEIELDTSNIDGENIESEVKEILIPVVNSLKYTQDVPISDKEGNVIGKYGFGFNNVVDALTESLKDNSTLNNENNSNLEYISKEEYDKLPKDYKGTVKELKNIRPDVYRLILRLGYTDDDVTVMELTKNGTTLVPKRLQEDLNVRDIKKGIRKVLHQNNGNYTDDSIYDFIEALTGITNIDEIPEDLYEKVAAVADDILNTNYLKQPKLQEDQYENERRKGRPNVKEIAEDEFYDNQDWYIQHMKDYKDREDFINQNISEMCSEYNLSGKNGEAVCNYIYDLAIKNKLV